MLTLNADYLGSKTLPAKGDWPEGRIVRLDTGDEGYEVRATGPDLIALVDGLKRYEPVTAEIALRPVKGESSVYRLALTGLRKKTP